MTTYTSGFTSGNLEAFARSRKPAGVDVKRAYFVSSGFSSLAGAVFLIRDAHMLGSKITILEQDELIGCALDGIQEPDKGDFVIRGGRELEDHYECLWDLFRSIPIAGGRGRERARRVLLAHKDDPNYLLCRVTHQRGFDAQTEDKFGLSSSARGEIRIMFLATREQMEDKRIDEVL